MTTGLSLRDDQGGIPVLGGGGLPPVVRHEIHWRMTGLGLLALGGSEDPSSGDRMKP
jgi:hypothetical protein